MEEYKIILVIPNMSQNLAARTCLVNSPYAKF
jgi:hypothetical protein